jgi:hypothetical protein
MSNDYNNILEDLEKYDSYESSSSTEDMITLRNEIALKVAEMAKNNNDKKVLALIEKIGDLILEGHYSNPPSIYGFFVMAFPQMHKKCAMSIVNHINAKKAHEDKSEYVYYAKYSPAKECVVYLADFNNNGETVWSNSLESVFNDYRSFYEEDKYYDCDPDILVPGLEKIDSILMVDDLSPPTLVCHRLTEKHYQSFIDNGGKVKHIDRDYFIEKYMEK